LRTELSGESPCRFKDAESERGFKLIELLGVIAILAALLLTALSGAKSRAWTIACLNNMKRFEIHWHAYALDYDDRLVPSISGNSAITNGGGGSIVQTFLRHLSSSGGPFHLDWVNPAVAR
jgi:competence protein ComGC